MGCCGEREKFGDLRVEQKWEYINLDDFKARSCWAGFAYGYLWFMLFVSISVYAVDTFTAVNLLAFDRWAGRVKPAIPLHISRWIFAGCIILSFVLLFYRWIRAIKVMRQGGVAKSYLDPLAVRLQSIRMGEKGRGWRRFLVFAELTKSKKGADYVALFSYFSFEAWLRIVFAEGPRQVINAITIYSFTKDNLLPEGEHHTIDGHSKFDQFWLNVGLMADHDRLGAVVLFGMLWTLVIWIFAAICLAVSVVLYLLFLWHHIPSGDGGLARYCRIKINRRMERIVKVKVDKALKQENELRARQEAKAARDGLEMKKQPTLPSLDISIDSLPPLSRQTTLTTLPEYSSRPGSAGNDLDSAPPVPSLPQTTPPESHPSKTRESDTSWSSYASNAPLIHQAADMAYSTPGGAANPYTAPGAWNARPPPPSRSMTGMSAMSGPAPMRPPTAQSGRNTPRAYPHEPISRPGTTINNGPSRSASNGSDNSTYQAGAALPRGMLPRTGSWDQQVDHQARRTPVQATNPYFPPILETDSGRSSPMPNSAPSSRNHTPFSGPPRSRPPPRSYSPAGPPPRSSGGGGSLPDQSFTPRGPPPRSLTAGPPTDRSFTPVATLPRSLTAGPPISDRSFTPVAALPRSLTAGPPLSDRSMTPVGLPPRSFSAGIAPPDQSFTRSASRPDQPTLPQIDTYDSVLDSYRTPTPEPLSTTASHPEWQETQYSNSQDSYSFHRPAPQRQGTGGSEVDDILRHY